MLTVTNNSAAEKAMVHVCRLHRAALHGQLLERVDRVPQCLAAFLRRALKARETKLLHAALQAPPDVRHDPRLRDDLRPIGRNNERRRHSNEQVSTTRCAAAHQAWAGRAVPVAILRVRPEGLALNDGHGAGVVKVARRGDHDLLAGVHSGLLQNVRLRIRDNLDDGNEGSTERPM